MARLAFVVAVLAALAVLAPQCHAQTDLRASGASFPFPFYSDWFFAYAFQNNEVSVEYESTGSGIGRRQLFEGITDFAGSDSPLSPAEKEANPNVVQVPFLAGSAVAIYNLPELENEGQLTFTLELLGMIYTRKVTRWNDPEIAKLNPDLKGALPDKPISLVVRSDSSGTTEIYTTAIAVGSKDFQEQIGPVQMFPKLADNVTRADGNLGVYALTFQNPYSLGYCSLSLIRDNGGTFANIQLHSGDVVSPDRQFVEVAMDQATFADDNSSELTALKGAYPIIGFTYLMFDRSNPDCDKLFAFARLVRWTLITELAQSRAESLGYSPLSSKLQTFVLDTILAPIQCDQLGLLEQVAQDQHSGGAYLIPFILSEVGMGLCVLIVAVSMVMRLANMGLSVFTMNVCMIIGILLNAASLVFFYLVPDEDWICQLRLWLCALGFTVLLSVLFARAIQIVFIYHRSRSLRRTHGNLLQKLLVVSIVSVFLMQMLILILWTAIDMYASDFDEVDEINLTIEYKCTSDTLWVWALLEALLLMLVVMWGLIVVYITWNSRSLESKWILFSLYNEIALFCAMAPLFLVLDVDDDTQFYLFTVGISLGTICLVFGLHFPMLVNRIYKLTSSSGATTSKRRSSTGSTSK